MSIPLGMGVNSLYLFLWKVVPNFYARWFPRLPLYGLLTVVFLTNISAWFTCTVTLQYLLEHLHASSSSSSSSLGSTTMDSVHEKESPSQGSSFHPSLQWIYILGLSATVMAWVIGAGVCWAPLRAPKGHARTPWYIYLIRGLGTGCTTALGIYVSTTHAYLGGLITVFPVIFTTTVVSVWIYQGKAVSQGAIGPLMLGQTSTGCLVCMMTFLPRSLPFYGALLVSWVVCVVGVNAPVYVYVQWRMKVTQRKRERKTMVRESRGGEVENDVEERRV
ncbi:hypothetical protein HMI54_015158 [Coelomomyces lativittatus]|nr:hypothetical protein HMI55_003856 [Coelomomyces lativittatus]KAJ1513216.1 hypothetical protein HMI54_015158 [Coelomomyces lativittatus]